MTESNVYVLQPKATGSHNKYAVLMLCLLQHVLSVDPILQMLCLLLWSKSIECYKIGFRYLPDVYACTVLQSKRVNFVSFYIKFYNLKPDAY